MKQYSMVASLDTSKNVQSDFTPRTSSMHRSVSNKRCVLRGRVYTERLWYGYIIDKAFHRDYAKIQYTISYPIKECCTNLLVYYDDQIRQLTQDMTCEQREGILPVDNNQVIPLHTRNRTIGCRVWNDTESEPFYVCVGERIFRSRGTRTWYFALSRCNAKTPLTLNYNFNVTGYYGECEEDPLVKTYIPLSPTQASDGYLALTLGIVAGVAVVVAIFFFGLWLLGQRRISRTKRSSVTSSQATMTQDDIFYVNPSLSDRVEHHDYSQGSSENYYEVIPEGRNYESVNHHLLSSGSNVVHHPLLQAHPHLAHHIHHSLATHPRFLHFRAGQQLNHLGDSAFHRPQQRSSTIPGTFLGDYPPPPYQPPRLLGESRHHTLHHAGNHNHMLGLHPTNHQRSLVFTSGSNRSTFTSLFSPVQAPDPAPVPGLGYDLFNKTANENCNNTVNSKDDSSMSTALIHNTDIVVVGETTAWTINQ